MNLDAVTEQRLRKLVEVFLEENAKINLSAFRTVEQCWVGNVGDSVAIMDADDVGVSKEPRIKNEERRVLDMGTGGGFPLLPLAICMPDARFFGLDSVQKKLSAISRIAGKMNLGNVELLAGRAEEFGRDPRHREMYDLVTARAVAPINTLLEYCSPFVKPGGRVVLWKSLNIDQELQDSLLARAEFSCHLTAYHRYDLGEGWGERQLLIFEKTAKLSNKYPRGVGVPKKDPLT